jgi:hypothetical protein
MKCMDRKAIQEYSDSEVSEIEAKRIEGHLPECPACKKLLEKIEEEKELVRNKLSRLNPDEIHLGEFKVPEERITPKNHSLFYKKIFASTIRIPVPVGIILVLIFLGLAADVVKLRIDKAPSLIRSLDIEQGSTLFLYSADSVQAFDLKIDLSNYRPIEKSNAFVFKEAIQ